jgi:hypothetical protein
MFPDEPIEPGAAKIRSRDSLNDSLQAFFRFHLALPRRECDSKANPIGKSGALPQLAKNFPFTNQRADSFSSSGVNLEAKV